MPKKNWLCSCLMLQGFPDCIEKCLIRICERIFTICQVTRRISLILTQSTESPNTPHFFHNKSVQRWKLYLLLNQQLFYLFILSSRFRQNRNTSADDTVSPSEGSCRVATVLFRHCGQTVRKVILYCGQTVRNDSVLKY